MAESARFWDRIANKYSRTPIADMDSYQQKVRITQSYLTPQSNVLEIGCGTGSTALLHADVVNHILATDISENMIGIANQKKEKQGADNVEFRQASLNTLGVDGEFDMVMAHSLLHLVEDRDEAIRRMSDWLKPGGTLVTSTACLGDKMKFFKFIGPIGHFLRLIPMVKVFSEQELHDSFIKAGFTIEQQWRPEKAMSVFFVVRKPAA